MILRISWVYDAHGKDFVRAMLRLAKTREEIGVVHDQRGRPSCAPDVANALASVARRLVTDVYALLGVFHVTVQGEICSWRVSETAIFAEPVEQGGPVARVNAITAAEYPAPARRPGNSGLDCGRIASVYGVSLPPCRESLVRCLDTIAAKGWQVG